MRRSLVLPGVVLLLALNGCDRPPSPGDAKEWTPQDHDQIEANSRAAQGQAPGQAPGPGQAGQAGGAPMAMPSGQKLTQLIEQLWASVCLECHGANGKGDGPKAAETKPPDMTDPAWQAKISDAEMTASIKNGKGKMPKYGLPDPFIAGLIQRIRAFRTK